MNTSDKKIGINDIVLEGETILKKCRDYFNNKYLETYKKNHKVKKMDKNCYKELYSMATDADYKDLHKKIVNEHNKFSSVYAIVVRSIVYENIYYSDVMKKYVNHLTNHPWKSREEFIERQSEYLIYLHKEMNPRIGSQELAAYKNYVQKQLNEEDKKFKEYEEEVKTEVNKEWDDIVEERRDKLKRELERLIIAKKVAADELPQ